MGSAPDLLLDDPQSLIQGDSEAVFYCAKPKEATSARMALVLNRHGYVESPVDATAR
jgi:hypothetical protein